MEDFLMNPDRNPFEAELEALNGTFHKLCSEKADWEARLTWHSRLDVDAVHARQMEAARQASRAMNDSLSVKVKINDLEKILPQLKREASIGLNPFSYFTSQHAVAKRKLAVQQQKMNQLEQQYKALKEEERSNAEQASHLKEDLNRYRAFDPLRARDTLRYLDAEIVAQSYALSALTAKHADADKQLQPLYAELDKLEQQQATLTREIEQAKEFEQRLQDTEDSYEKAMIHRQCEALLGDDRPRNILQTRKRQIRFIEANITKQKNRLRIAIKRITGDIRSIVIDGNNLCYNADSTRIGLVALEALVPALLPKYHVTIVFDPGAPRMLKMRVHQIRARFDPSVTVHVMKSSNAADETILTVAGATPGAYILSNDNYGEFKDKTSVSNKQVLKYEMVGNVVHVPDLDIHVSFEAAA